MPTLRTGWAGLLAAVVAVTLLGGAAPAEADHARPPALVGFATNDWRSDLADFEAAVGEHPATMTLFWSMERPEQWSVPFLEALHDRGMIPYIELEVGDGDDAREEFRALARGERRDELDAFAQTLAGYLPDGDGRQVLLAPMPEPNLDEHAWGGDPARYRQAYHRVRAAVTRAGLTRDHVRFVFAVNGLSSRDLSYRDFWMGPGAADVVGFAKINRGDPWRDYRETFQRHIDEMRRDIGTTKPLFITQTGSVAHGDEGQTRDGWLDRMFTSLASHPQIVGAMYYNRDRPDWGADLRVLIDGRMDPAYRDGARSWSPQAASSWLFDGRADDWVRAHGGTPAAAFVDVAGSPFAPAIADVAAAGITAGCGIDLYCPSVTVDRAQMATFLDRALDLPEAERDHFDDDDGSPHEGAIDRVAQAGITDGCDPAAPRRYCPGLGLNRAQMATLLDRALDLPDAERDHFSDDDGSPHEGAINRVAQAGITEGCAPGRFCPGTRVSRAQMAAFLDRAFG